MTVKQNSDARVNFAYRKRQNAKDMKHQVISFVLMIALTLVSFIAVEYNEQFNPVFTVPVILVLAIVQVIFQLYYFMHMSHKGHEMPAFFLYGGLTVGIITILTYMTIVWI